MAGARSTADDAQVARAFLAPLEFLVGRWTGEGQEGGLPLASQAEARWILDGTWLEIHEAVRDREGQGVHEDLTLYRYDPEQGHLRVIHCLKGGWQREWPVQVGEDRVLWITGPGGPRVELVRHEDGWSARITLPGASSATTRYRRAGP